MDEKEKTASGAITVTKNLYDEEYKDLMVEDGVFYVALFADQQLTTRVSAVSPITFKGVSSSSTTFEDLDPGTQYYVTETDKNGVPLDESNDLTFTYTVEGGDVVLNYENNRAEVVITNEFEEVTPTVTPAGDITETPGGSDDSHTTSTYVKTGDDTPIGLYVTLLVLAACAVVAAVVLAKKKNKKD